MIGVEILYSLSNLPLGRSQKCGARVFFRRDEARRVFPAVAASAPTRKSTQTAVALATTVVCTYIHTYIHTRSVLPGDISYFPQIHGGGFPTIKLSARPL